MLMSTTMSVAALEAPRRAGLITKPVPRVLGDYVLVKVHVAPMCNEHHAYANWDFRDRNRPDSLGHEAAGEVVEAGPESSWSPGDRVVALSGYPCGGCHLCREGRYAHCQGTINPLPLNGSLSGEAGFAQYLIKPGWLLVAIPNAISYEHASMACCGLGATYTALEDMEVAAGETVLVTGLGQVGLGAVINSVARGARVLAVARHPYRLDLARRLGAEVVLGLDDPDLRRRVLDLTDGRGVDAAIECSAGQRYQRLGLDVLRRGGRMTFLGESGELVVDVDRDIIQKAVSLRGSLDLNLHHAAGVIDVISRSAGAIDEFITHRLPMSRISEAWETQLAGECGKIILYPWH